jgi:hypothetical protein
MNCSTIGTNDVALVGRTTPFRIRIIDAAKIKIVRHSERHAKLKSFGPALSHLGPHPTEISPYPGSILDSKTL